MTVNPQPSPASPQTPPPRLVTVGRIDYPSTFEFTHLFRGFRLAMNPAKIVLALLAIMLIYMAGRGFDLAWGPQVYAREIELYQTESSDILVTERARRLDERQSSLRSQLLTHGAGAAGVTSDQISDLSRNPRGAYRELKRLHTGDFHRAVEDARQRRKDAETAMGREQLRGDERSLGEIEQTERFAAARNLQRRINTARETAGRGIFQAFLEYEISQFENLVNNTLRIVRVEDNAVTAGVVSRTPEQLWTSDTIAGSIGNIAITGPAWLFTATGPMQWRPENAGTWGGWLSMIGYRGVYLASLLLFALFALAVLVLTGATIARLSALEFSGIERPLLKDVFLFALRRFSVFIRAPLTPLAILLVLAILLGIMGLIGAIPFIGEILLGLFFIVFLAVAFIAMLLLLGILGGFHLLVPAVAVESADTYDAMSRAFAYVYARPWKLIFYTLVALMYGVITLLFVTFAVYLILVFTHICVGWGTSLLGYNHAWYAGTDKLSAMWPMPRMGRLTGPINWAAMSWSEYIGSILLHFWVFSLVSAIAAYVISYYFSSNTILYLLLRRAADGQPLNEVYLEEPEPMAPMSPVSATAAPASETAPAAGSGGAQNSPDDRPPTEPPPA